MGRRPQPSRVRFVLTIYLTVVICSLILPKGGVDPHKVLYMTFFSGVGQTSFLTPQARPSLGAGRQKLVRTLCRMNTNAPMAAFGSVTTSVRQTAHVASRWFSIKMTRAMEIAASLLGLTGMALGSTTLYGAICYAVGVPCLVWCVVWKRRAWGLLPLNLAQMVVIAVNLWRAI